ncbi:hypothetical protein P4O66_022781, partial [Electrophorus voltai]
DSCAEVRLAPHGRTEQLVAVKCIRKRAPKGKETMLENEVAVLRTPELLQQKTSGKGVDLWALGVILFILQAFVCVYALLPAIAHSLLNFNAYWSRVKATRIVQPLCNYTQITLYMDGSRLDTEAEHTHHMCDPNPPITTAGCADFREAALEKNIHGSCLQADSEELCQEPVEGEAALRLAVDVQV